MNVLILSRTPMSYSPYHEWLAGLDADLYLFTSSMTLDLPPLEQEKANQAYKRIELFENYDLNGQVVIQALALHRELRIDAIIATSEFDLMRAAELREYLGLTGQTTASAVAFRDKVVMKDHLSKRGINITPYAAIESTLDVLKFIERYGYPVVIKPRLGAGSMGVTILSNDDELLKWSNGGISSRVEDVPRIMIEKFVPGQLYHVDGLIYREESLVHWPSCYTTKDRLTNQRNEPGGSIQLTSTHPLRRRLQDMTRQVLDALPTPAITTFHAEVFHTPDDKLVLGEIASRTGGGRVNDSMRIAFGLNINRLWVQAQAGMSVELEAARQESEMIPQIYCGWIMLPPYPAIFRGAPSSPPFTWVADYRVFPKPGTKLMYPVTTQDQVANFLVTGDNETQLIERLNTVASWFWSEVDISPIA